MGRVLYLDDEKALVELVSEALERLGHPVSGFTDATAALAEFRSHPRMFDLVLTDMSMRGMSGLEFAQQILLIEPRAVVVIATGCPDPNWADYARAAGVRDVIEKPGTVRAMADAISVILGGK